MEDSDDPSDSDDGGMYVSSIAIKALRDKDSLHHVFHMKCMGHTINIFKFCFIIDLSCKHTC